MHHRFFISILLLTMASNISAQDSIPVPVRGTCKDHRLSWLSHPERMPIPGQHEGASGIKKGNLPFLKIHGNILYDLNYRSNIDTPYAEKEVYQHTIQTYLDITVKDRYPFRVYVTNRFSNSPWFRNFSNVNMLYNSHEFNNQVKRQVRNLLLQRPDLDSLNRLKGILSLKQWQYDSLRRWLEAPAQLQRLIRAREIRWLRLLQDSAARQQGPRLSATMPDASSWQRYKFPSRGSDSPSSPAKADTLSKFADDYARTSKRADSLKEQLDSLSDRYQAFKTLAAKEEGRLGEDINGISSGKELKEKLHSLQISDSSLPRGYQTLYSIRSFGIGRTLLDYSELSTKNISINGLQVEYNPHAYMALALGTVDYRFRDYTMQNPRKGQYIGLIRYGWGMKDGNNIIFTYYTGKRQLYNSYTSPQGAEIPNYSLMGFTVEGRIAVNRYTSLTAEVAKSSSPYYSLDSGGSHNALASALRISDHSNEAWSLKLRTLIPSTETQVNASYRRFGANFQSFSLFTTGTEQSAWSVKVEQPFFKRHLQVTGSIRTNDLSNPLLNASYKSNTVFKSIQATLRLKKWPVLSAGYFPSSQVTKISDNEFQENLFYMFMLSASHSYHLDRVSMTGMLMYTQFYNKIADTGFAYFNTKNILLSQSAFVGDLSFQTQLSAAMNTSYSLYTIDNRVEYKFNSWLSLGAGVKYNQQTVYNIDQWGYSGSASLRVPAIGEFRLMADKGFIPGGNRQLVENKLGRLTYLKVF